MADSPVGSLSDSTPGAGARREVMLRQEYHGQTAQIPWHELQTYYARGNVVCVSPGLDLVEVAVQLGMDNTTQFQQWIEQGSVAGVSEEQALGWYERNETLWAVVAAPWVLVQQAGKQEVNDGEF